MRAFQISEFHQLMTDKSRVAFGDHQMSLTLLDHESGSKVRRRCPRGVHHEPGLDLCAIGEDDAAFSDMSYRNAELKPGSVLLSVFRQEAGRARGIQHGIFRDQQATLHS